MNNGKQEKIEVFHGSGNVFRDLGFPDADELATKAALVSQLNTMLKQRGLSDAKAAKRFRTSARRLSRLFVGRLDEYTIDELLCFINKLSHDIEIVIRPRTKARRKGATTVVVA
jgi:predicted XRE-type DNA-binding protein